MRKLIRKPARTPGALLTDKLGSYGAARRSLELSIARKIRISLRGDECSTRSGSNRPAMFNGSSPPTIQSPTRFTCRATT